MAVSFLQFLKDNGIEDFEDRLTGEIEEDNPYDWILNAFEWGSQPEGDYFWQGLNEEWIFECMNYDVCYGKEFPEIFKG